MVEKVLFQLEAGQEEVSAEETAAAASDGYEVQEIQPMDPKRLPALTEAVSRFWRPIKYSLFPPLGLATLAGYLRDQDEIALQDEHVGNRGSRLTCAKRPRSSLAWRACRAAFWWCSTRTAR